MATEQNARQGNRRCKAVPVGRAAAGGVDVDGAVLLGADRRLGGRLLRAFAGDAWADLRADTHINAPAWHTRTWAAYTRHSMSTRAHARTHTRALVHKGKHDTAHHTHLVLAGAGWVGRRRARFVMVPAARDRPAGVSIAGVTADSTPVAEPWASKGGRRISSALGRTF